MNTAWDYSSRCIKMFVILVCGHARRGLSFQPCWFSSWVSWHLLFSSWEPKPGSVWLKDSLSFPLRGASAPFSKGVRHGHGTPGRSASSLVHPRGSAVPLRLHTWSSIGCGTGLCQARGAWGVVGLQPHGAPHTSGYGHLLSSAVVTRASFTALHPSPR